MDALKKGLCTEKEEAECEEEFGENLEWTCANCPKGRTKDLHPYTQKLLRLRALKKAGYPFNIEDLTLEEWLDLGKVMQWLETPALFGSKSE